MTLGLIFEYLPKAIKHLPKVIAIGQELISNRENRLGKRLTNEEKDEMLSKLREGDDEAFNNYFNNYPNND